MKLSKRQIQAALILLAIVIAFSVVVFFVPFNKDGTFWISYISELVALFLQIPVFKLAYDNAHDLKSKVLGFPIIRVGYIYLGIQTITSIALMSVSTVIRNMPIWISAVLCIIILTAAFVCSIVTDIAREEVVKIESAQRIDTDFMREMRVKTQNIAKKAYDNESKKLLESLAESFRFSDPVSSVHTRDIENRIESEILNLEDMVSKKMDVTQICKKISEILNDRNNICKAYKQYK